MSLVHCDSFNTYTSLAHVAERYDAVVNAPAIAIGGGRNGSSALRLDHVGGASAGTAARAIKNVANPATAIVGFAFKANGFGGTWPILRLQDNGSEQITLWLRSDLRLEVRRGATVLGTGTTVLSATVFRFVELKATIHDSTGAVEVRVDGVADIGPLTNQDTQQTANAFVTQVLVGDPTDVNIGAGNTASDYAGDFYICDSAGSVNNTFLGDVRVEAKRPSGTGNSAQFTPSAGANWENVDDTTPDDDTTYNESVTVGHKDTFAMENLASSLGTVLAVATLLRCRKTDAGARTVRSVVRLSAVESESADIAPSTAYDFYQSIFETKPGGGAWTPADVDAMEAGYKVQA